MKRTIVFAQLLLAVAASAVIGIGHVAADDTTPSSEQRVIVIARAATAPRKVAEEAEQPRDADVAVNMAIEAVAADNRELLEIRLTDHILVDSSAAR